MSTLAQRSSAVQRRANLPLASANSPYFVLGQNARGLWVIRENTGKKAGVFQSREAALRFARIESPNEQFTVVHFPDGLEFDYAS
jgi:hypothetical protein